MLFHLIERILEAWIASAKDFCAREAQWTLTSDTHASWGGSTALTAKHSVWRRELAMTTAFFHLRRAGYHFYLYDWPNTVNKTVVFYHIDTEYNNANFGSRAVLVIGPPGIISTIAARWAIDDKLRPSIGSYDFPFPIYEAILDANRRPDYGSGFQGKYGRVSVVGSFSSLFLRHIVMPPRHCIRYSSCYDSRDLLSSMMLFVTGFASVRYNDYCCDRIVNNNTGSSELANVSFAPTYSGEFSTILMQHIANSRVIEFRMMREKRLKEDHAQLALLAEVNRINRSLVPYMQNATQGIGNGYYGSDIISSTIGSTVLLRKEARRIPLYTDADTQFQFPDGACFIPNPNVAHAMECRDGISGQTVLFKPTMFINRVTSNMRDFIIAESGMMATGYGQQLIEPNVQLSCYFDLQTVAAASIAISIRNKQDRIREVAGAFVSLSYAVDGKRQHRWFDRNMFGVLLNEIGDSYDVQIDWKDDVHCDHCPRGLCCQSKQRMRGDDQEDDTAYQIIDVAYPQEQPVGGNYDIMQQLHALFDLGVDYEN